MYCPGMQLHFRQLSSPGVEVNVVPAQCMHFSLPRAFWNMPIEHFLQAGHPPFCANWPGMQAEHFPAVPCLPAGQVMHDVSGCSTIVRDWKVRETKTEYFPPGHDLHL